MGSRKIHKFKIYERELVIHNQMRNENPQIDAPNQIGRFIFRGRTERMDHRKLAYRTSQSHVYHVALSGLHRSKRSTRPVGSRADSNAQKIYNFSGTVNCSHTTSSKWIRDTRAAHIFRVEAYAIVAQVIYNHVVHIRPKRNTKKSTVNKNKDTSETRNSNKRQRPMMV